MVSEILAEERRLMEQIKPDILSKLAVTIMKGEIKEAWEMSRAALDAHLPIMDVLTKGCYEGLKAAGKLFLRPLRLYKPQDAVMVVESFLTAVEVLRPALRAERLNAGVVVIGVMIGDFHHLGNKYFVAPTLKAVRYEVYDLGVEVPAKKFVEKAQAVNADAIMVSSTINNSKVGYYLKEIDEGLKRVGIRNKAVCLAGGENAYLTEKVVLESGFDAYAQSCLEAVGLIEEIMRAKRSRSQS